MYIFLDIGGSYTKIASSSNLKELENFSYFKTPKKYLDGKNKIEEEIEKIVNSKKVKKIVVAIAGLVDEKKNIANECPNINNWSKRPLAKNLKQKFKCQVYLKNDAQLSALGESVYNNLENKKIIAYLSLGTGVGGALVVNNNINPNHFGFEPGRQIIKNNQSLEKLIGSKNLKTGNINLHDWHKNLAIGICNTAYFWSPELIIIGGGLAEKYLDLKILKKIIKQYFSIDKNIKIKKSKLKRQSALWGGLYFINNQ